MFEQFITPINFPELIKRQARANVTFINQREINSLKANEKAMINNVNGKAKVKYFPRRYSK